MRLAPVEKGENMGTRLANARIDEAVLGRANSVFQRNRTTLSEVIRNVVTYVARTGTIPECGCSPVRSRAGAEERFQMFRDYVASLPQPGRDELAGKSDRDILGDARMARYGYDL